MNTNHLIKEFIELSLGELEKTIGAMPPSELAWDDYVDAETGEIYLEKGHTARTSKLHPEYARDQRLKRAAQQKADAHLGAQWAKEDEEWEGIKALTRKEADDAYRAALSEYAGNWIDHKTESGDEFDDAQSVAHDASIGFFYQFPEWKQWATKLGMQKADIQSAVAEFVYEAIISGHVPAT